MSLGDKLKNAGKWQLLQVVTQVAVQFGYISIMARLLDKKDFGLMAIATAFIGLGMVFSTGGLGSALIQKKELSQKHLNAAFQGSLILGIFAFIILLSVSGLVANFYNEPKLELIIKIVALSIVFNSVSSVSRSILQKSFRFKDTAKITMAVTFISYSLGVGLAILDYGVWSLILASLCTSILTSLIMFYFAPIKLSLNFYYKEFKELFKFGFGIVLLGLNNYLSSGGINLVLGKILPPAMLGIFERTYVIKTLPSQYLGNILDTVMFPAMSEIQDENKKLFQIYQYGLGITNTILMPLALYLIFYSKQIVLILLGDKWLEAVLPLQIMFIVLPFSASGRMADSVIRAKGFVYKNVIRKFLFAIILLSSTFLGVKLYGVVGASVAVTLSHIFNYCIMLLLVQSIFKRRLLEIFWLPIFYGIKISFTVFILIITITTVLKTWSINLILEFIVSSILLGICMFFLLLKKPEFFGTYFQDVLYRISLKRK